MPTTPETTCDCHPGQLNAHGHTVAELAGKTPAELATQWQEDWVRSVEEAGFRSLRTEAAEPTPTDES